MSIPLELLDQNPWWRNQEAIEHDKYIKTRHQSKVPWAPRLRYKFLWNEDIIYTLRGPRQVGKTTLLKYIIQDLLISGVPQRNIFYYTCDLISTPKELANILSSYLDFVGVSSNKRRYIFLDEISSIRDWQQAIKLLVDTGKLVSSTVILTGSHSLDIKRASERLPGRRGVHEDVPDKMLLPMKFAEYAETLNETIKNKLRELFLLKLENRLKAIKSLVNGKIPDTVHELSYFTKEINNLFHNYLLTGGMPQVIDNYLKNNQIAENIYRTYVDVVIGDLARWNKRENYLRQILRRVIASLGNPIAWNALKKNTDIGSHNTVADYVTTLQDSFILLILYHYNINRRAPNYHKQKRLHFQDPFFFHALNAWITGRDPFPNSLNVLKVPEILGLLVESVIANHLARLAFAFSQQKQLFDYETSLFYWKSKKKREIDFILRTDNNYIPLEVKYQSTIRKSDFYGIFDFIKSSGSRKGLVLSKNHLEIRSELVVVPTPLFLLLI